MLKADGMQQLGGSSILQKEMGKPAECFSHKTAIPFKKYLLLIKNTRNQNNRNLLVMEGTEVIGPYFILNENGHFWRYDS